MKETIKISIIGKNYCLKHIHLIRDFCFACNQAITQGNFVQADFYKNRAYRVIKGINPFCKLVKEQDRKFLVEAKKQLASFFTRTESNFIKIETNYINNILEELIIKTIEIESNVIGMNFIQLSKQIFMENSNNRSLFSNSSKII